ncbi:hypothetical protein H0A70_07695 [Alcaligenaceae bacterium]|nr:hypothetical protein [Alcaligenaceae bacterium]
MSKPMPDTDPLKREPPGATSKLPGSDIGEGGTPAGKPDQDYMRKPNAHRPDPQREPPIDVPPKPGQPLPNPENPDLPGTTPIDPDDPGQGQPIPLEMDTTKPRS